MRFTLSFREYSSGDYDTISPPVCQIPGAQMETKYQEQRRAERWSQKAKAILNEQGEPVIAYERVEDKPDANWLHVGQNHHHADGYYSREVPYRVWFTELGTLESFVAFVREYAGEFDADDMSITIDWKQKYGL